MLVLTASHRFPRTHLNTQLPHQVSEAETEHLAAKAEGAAGAGKSSAGAFPFRAWTELAGKGRLSLSANPQTALIRPVPRAGGRGAGQVLVLETKPSSMLLPN